MDAGYANGEGFLAPYRGYRYHRSEWRRGYTPSNKEELFNMRHSMARNVIERTFGLLKCVGLYLGVDLSTPSKFKFALSMHVVCYTILFEEKCLPTQLKNN